MKITAVSVQTSWSWTRTTSAGNDGHCLVLLIWVHNYQYSSQKSFPGYIQDENQLVLLLMVRTLEPLPDENGWCGSRTVSLGTKAQREYQNASIKAPQGVRLKG
eukprot:4106450-Ditylum_brightwellii.AAC.1